MDSDSASPSPFNTTPSTATPSSSSQSTSSTPKQTVICVFCGSLPGSSPSHMAAARALGIVLAKNNISLVYGGGTVGLMGEVARTLVSLSGPTSVHGVIPAPLVKHERGPDSKVEAKGLPEEKIYGKTTVVPDMHSRKQMMAREVLNGGEGSGFVALSGGYGTLEELMEVVTWNQLGIHGRGVVVLNVDGYYDGLLQWVNNSVSAGFIQENNREIIKEAKTAEEVVTLLKNYQNTEGKFKLTWGQSSRDGVGEM